MFSPPLMNISLTPSGDVAVNVGVNPAGVSGVHLAAAQRLRCCLGLMPVLAHHLGTAYDDFADLPLGQFGVGLVDDADLGAYRGPSGRQQELRLAGEGPQVVFGSSAVALDPSSVMP
jgi:hypothetical protein